MGQTLSEPVVDKHSDHGEDNRFVYGVSSMQGWRISMEDAHSCVLDLRLDGSAPTTAEKRIAFFGVYDGHGGDKVAIYTGEYLHTIIANQEAFRNGDLVNAIKDGFLATDRAILSDPRYEDEVSGCTACVGLMTSSKIFVGNAGDSRGVLGIKGRAKPLSFDHKPQNETEKARIQAAGGFVDFGRVNGNLALSRAIGDFEFKKTPELPPEQQIVTAYPDVTEHDITEDDEFVVIACDGIWDCQSSQAVVEFVRRGIVAKQELSEICENLMDNCLSRNSENGGVGCDNMTVTIIGLLNGKTKEQWYDLVAERVANGDGPCAPPEYAERRGPGVSHGMDENHDDYDMPMELDSRSAASNFSRLSRGIILLGDGSGFGISAPSGPGGGIRMATADDIDMMDRDEEDRDLEAQVARHTPPSGSEEEDDEPADGERSRREETPGPQAAADTLPSRAHVDTTAAPVAAKEAAKLKEEEPKTTATDAAEPASSAEKPKEDAPKA